MLALLCSRLWAAGWEDDVKCHRPGSWEPLLHARPHAHTLMPLHPPLLAFFSICPQSLGHLTVPVPPLPCLSHVRAHRYLSEGHRSQPSSSEQYVQPLCCSQPGMEPGRQPPWKAFAGWPRYKDVHHILSSTVQVSKRKPEAMKDSVKGTVPVRGNALRALRT